MKVQGRHEETITHTEKNDDSTETVNTTESLTSTPLAKRSVLLFVSTLVVRFVERVCGLWGHLVASHPFLAAIGCVAIVALLGSGLVRLNLVFRPYDLWVPQKSEFSQVTEWKTKNFPHLYREQIAIWEGENVISAASIREILKFHNKVEQIRAYVNDAEVEWTDVCVQVPTINNSAAGNSQCYEMSPLEAWGYNFSVYENLNDSAVIFDINNTNKSTSYGTPFNISSYLGGVTRDNFGNIIKAKTAIHTWLTIVNKEDISRGSYEMDIGTGEHVDSAGMAWEKALVELASKWNGDMHININAGHTLGHVLYDSVTKDAMWIGIGWGVLLFYVLFTLGKPLMHNQMIIPACVGLLAIGMSVLSSYGACSYVGIPYGTLTNVLPVLLVALGVDDMYVIVAAWERVQSEDSLIYKAEMTMRKAGMAITITSITDILAFLVGTSTTLPGLRWFCIYSAAGITMVYFLQSTLFVASMVVNQQWNNSRKQSNSNVINSKIKLNLKKVMKSWGNVLKFPAAKIVVVFVTVAMFGYSSFNLTQLSREFDTIWLVPESSSLYKWINVVEKTFPQKNEKGVILFKGVKFPEDLSELKKLSKKINALPDVLGVDAWFNEIDLEETFRKNSWLRRISPLKQCRLLLQYISFASRRHFRIDFDLNNRNVSDNQTFEQHPCSTFQIEFQYKPPKTFEMKQKSMNKIRELVHLSDISGYKAVWAHLYGHWETDKIIIEDLIKSLCIVLSAVAFITLLLLASVRASFFVLVCVISTLVNVASASHLWGLTVNTVTGIAFILAVGICVDYSAHITHEFLTTTGTREERVISALYEMGPAVFHGGVSTCLTFILLSPSDSYIYISYFKILSSVSFFGLYHALVFLPVLLNQFGPEPHSDYSESFFIIPSLKKRHETSERGDGNISTNSSTVYSISLSMPMNPPSYIFSTMGVSPFYRKSSSLPSLALFISNAERDCQKETSASQSSCESSTKSIRHSACCTKL